MTHQAPNEDPELSSLRLSTDAAADDSSEDEPGMVLVVTDGLLYQAAVLSLCAIGMGLIVGVGVLLQ